MSFSHGLLAVVAFFSGLLFLVGAFRPALIWPSLIAALILGSGPMPFGLTIVDEFLVGSLLAGILYVWIKQKDFFRGTPPPRDVLFDIHRWIFVVFTLYLIFQCARGMIVMDSYRKVRWVVFFIVLGGFSLILDRIKETAPDRSRVAMWVVNSTTVYLLLYLIHGVTAHYFRGLSWWDLQCKEMGTTAYSMLPVALGAPASLIVIREGLWKRWMGEVCFVTMFVVGLYYDSRVSVLVLLGFLALGLFYVRWRVVLRVAGFYCLALFLFSAGFLAKKIDLHVLSKDLMSSGGADEVLQSRSTNAPPAVKVEVDRGLEPVSKSVGVVKSPMTSVAKGGDAPPTPVPPPPKPPQKRPHDIDRLVHAEVVGRLLSQGGTSALFGSGYRMSGRVISPILRELYSIYIPEGANKIADDAATEAFTAWVADTGIVGLGLLVALFVLTGVRAFRNSRGALGLILGCSATILFLWMFVINLSDVSLFYFSVLPSGLLVALSRPRGSAATS